MHYLIVSLAIIVNFVAALPASEKNPIDELYENLLQREDIGQIGFPKHEVERKAQRSPSLRLRFGRSDPSFMNIGGRQYEKRYYNWFGDVNQKPIRSPSLRLRFGRRNDPSIPIHGPHIDPDSDQTLSPNDFLPLSDVTSQSVRMLLDALKQIEEENNNQYYDKENNNNNDFDNTVFYETPNIIDEQQQQQTQHSDNHQQQFDRETRKPRGGQLRLRWGRSAGNIPSVNNMENNEEKSMDNSIGNEINKNSVFSSPPSLSSSASSSSSSPPLSDAINILPETPGNGNKN